MDVTAIIALAEAVTYIFALLTALALTAFKYPDSADVQANASFHYIVVGSGTAGSVIANRLSEDPNINVLLIEAGDDPQWETQIASLFPYLPKTKMDWNYTSENDNHTAQFNRRKFLELPSGKVLGGSSSMHHFYYVRGDPYDYDMWAEAAGDDQWTWANLLPYFMKSERLEDPLLLNSDTSIFHGKDGLVGLTRETRNDSLKYLDAFQEVGNPIKDDLCTNQSIGFGRPLFYIANGIRQSGAECFLATAKNRPNLYIMKSTTVRKVLFDQSMNALGVECSKADGTIINIYASKETILSAGAFNTPKILLSSGIGPKEDLESLGITVLHDSQVGLNLQDHLAILLCFIMESTNDTVKNNDPSKFNLATFVGTGTGTTDPLQTHANYVTLNLICRNNPAAVLLLSSVIFSLSNDVCNQLAAAATGKEVVFVVFNNARPVSTGKVSLRSSNPEDAPKIYMGHLSNNTDVLNNIAYMKNYLRVTNSSYFKSVGGKALVLDLPGCEGMTPWSDEYLECYIFHMMDTTFHYSSSCRMGTVTDSRLRVKGTNRLRVGDASVMPNQITGNINTPVMVIGEKLSDMIKEDNKESK